MYDIALSYSTVKQSLVQKVYHYLRAEGLAVFFAPECQADLIGKNQREAFYDVFGKKSEYVALFVNSNYIHGAVTMEEAEIAYATHTPDKVVAIYLDDSKLPKRLLDPKQINYFKAKAPALIAEQLAKKIRQERNSKVTEKEAVTDKLSSQFHVEGNHAEKQIFAQTIGSITL